MAEAGVPELLRRTGWIKLYRSDATLANAVRDFERAKQYGVAGRNSRPARRSSRASPTSAVNSPARSISPTPGFVPDPGGLAKAYAGAVPAARADAFWSAMRRTLEQEPDGRWRVDDARRHGERTRSRGGARTVVRSGVSAARLFDPAHRQARLSSASGAARQCRAASSRARCRSRLCAGADEPRHSPHHRGRVCPPRRAAHPGPAGAGAAAGARSCFRWARRSTQNPGWARGRVCRICCR